MAPSEEDLKTMAAYVRRITPEDSPKTFEDIIADENQRDLATAKLVPGDSALDFGLPVYDFSDGHERATGHTFQLGQVAADRPVALIFGSYT